MTENIPLRDERGEIAAAIERAADGGLNERIVLPIAEEFLTVGKRIEETGVVRVHKRTTERLETVRIETLREGVSVERVPIDRLVDGPVEVRQEGDTTVVPVLEEVVVVEKRLMLREEVRITRTRTTVPEERTVALRKEEAVIERNAPKAREKKTMANTLVGLFDDRDAAQNAVSDLIAAGFSRDKVSIIANDGSGGLATYDESGNQAAAGASSGATSGALVGGVAGVLIGLGFTVLPIAGVLLAGPIAGLVAGAATGAVTGGVVGGLIGLGIPKEHAELYAEGIRRGATLVTVSADASDESRIRDILDRDGATDVEDRAAGWKGQGYTGYDANAKPFTDAQIADERSRYGTSALNSGWNDTAYAPAPSTDVTYAASTTPSTGYADATTATNFTAPTGDKLEVVEERLNVGKREEERGGLRIRSFVTEKPVSQDITLREEHVDVQRTPVDRPATGDAFREGTIEMRETAEVPVVAKEARVVEEISLNKTASERTETINDTVRRTDVDIQNVGATNTTHANDWSEDTDYRGHFSRTNPTGDYDRYAPAYAYGGQLANDPTYGTGDWDTNESNYRSRWEERNPGTWDEFKASVRHAYDKAKNAVTGRNGNNASLR